MTLYLDSSALVKLAVLEDESEPLRKFVSADRDLVSSSLAIVEVVRSVRPHGTAAVTFARQLVDGLRLVSPYRVILVAATELQPIRLRSLDAIHVATALTLGRSLEALVTYDARMAEAARAAGLAVATPS